MSIVGMGATFYFPLTKSRFEFDRESVSKSEFGLSCSVGFWADIHMQYKSGGRNRGLMLFM